MAAKKRALITGITGQDGSYLAELLLDKGYEVFGVVRRLSAPNVWRIQHLLDRVTLLQADLLDQLSLIKAVETAQPDEFYNLAAMSFVPASWDQPMLTGEFNAQGVTRALEAVRIGQPEDPFLPGLVERDVRPGPRSAADRDDAVLSAQPVRRVEGVRALHHRQLPRELRPVCVLGHPLQPRVAAPRHRVRDAQGHRRRGAHQARAHRQADARQPRRLPRLGILRRLRARDVADAAAGSPGRLRHRHRRGAFGAGAGRGGVCARRPRLAEARRRR